MKTISEFKDIHKNKTMLLVGNGENLHLTPPEKFDYPSIGMNTIHLYEGWKPTYYTTVDRRVYAEFGKDIGERLSDIPKFIPRPRLAKWKGDNFYYFKNLQGQLWPKNRGRLWQEEIDREPLIYANIMHVAIKIAYFMGASTILIIGTEHKPKSADSHFWGKDKKIPYDLPVNEWLNGYQLLSRELEKREVKLLNISQDTYVSDDVIKTDDWNNWITSKKRKKSTEIDFEEIKE
jgi:hypothetical protein